MKNMPRFILPVLLLAAGTAGPLVVPAQAQKVSNFNGSSNGRGTLSINNANYSIRSVRLNLNNGGRMTATIRTDSGSYDISGSWESGRTDIDIKLDSFDNRRDLTGKANASLDAQGDRYRLARFSIDGSYRERGRSIPISGSFQIDTNSGGNWGGGGWNGGNWGGGNNGGGNNWNSDLALNVEGNGYWTQAGRPGQNIRAMKVGLSRNNNAQLELYMDRTYIINGTWQRYGNTATINISDMNGLRASGTAQVRLDGRTVKSVSINGDGTGGKFSLYFNVLSDGAGGWPGDDDGNFTTNGRGIIKLPNDEDAFTSAQVQFHSGDDVRIELRGPRTYTFTGTYRKQGDKYRINVTGSVKNDFVTGQGEVILRGNRIRTIHINGRTNGGDYAVDFDG